MLKNENYFEPVKYWYAVFRCRLPYWERTPGCLLYISVVEQNNCKPLANNNNVHGPKNVLANSQKCFFSIPYREKCWEFIHESQKPI